MAKRICLPTTTSSASLPCVVLHTILRMVDNGADVTAYLAALPPSTLPPELVALRDLGAVVDLTKHWPTVRVVDVPFEYARLAIDALPAFVSLTVDAGFRALAWLGATLPPTMRVSLAVDLSVPGNHTAFSHVWGDNVIELTIPGNLLGHDAIPDILGRCVNVEDVAIESSQTTPEDIAVCLSALSTKHLDILTVDAGRCRMVDTTAIVAWLQGPNASCFSLSCDSVRDPMALASAIESSSTLSALDLKDVLDVQEALAASPKSLHHITVLMVRVPRLRSDVALGLLRKLVPTRVHTVSVDRNFQWNEGDEDQEVPDTAILNDLAAYSSLKSLFLN